MEENIEKYCSGKICKLNEEKVDFRAEIYFNEYYEGIITIYNVPQAMIDAIKCREYNSAVMFLENKEYFSIFNFFVKQQVCSINFEDGNPIADDVTLVITSSEIISGKKHFARDDIFDEIIMEISDGYELIGKCPYDLNTSYADIRRYKDIHIPVKLEPIYVKTIIGGFQFAVFPQYQHSKGCFSIGFSHEIRFKPKKPINIQLFQKVLEQITAFFSLLCGEAVTINKLSMHESENTTMDLYKFIGFCNFPKANLRFLDNLGFDTTSFKRIYIFKITDFHDLEKAMNYWFVHYNELHNAQKAYSRILMDEDLKILKIDKFLDAMQMIEGYTQAFGDEESELKEFEKRKRAIIAQLQDNEEKELVEKGLGFSGISFRRALTQYLFEGLGCLEEISKTAFNKRHDALITKIINDRNFYTHSSKRIVAVLGFGEAMNVASVCKELYRILILSKMGLPQELLKYRMAHNRISVDLFNNLFGIKLNGEREFSGFDKDMCHFADEKK